MFKKLLILFLLLLPLQYLTNPAKAALTADEVADKVFHRDAGDDFQMQGIMELISKTGHTRVREYISLGKDDGQSKKVLIRFTSPADIADTGFLVLEDTKKDITQQHLYLPALQRTRRIVSSQMNRSFVNSDYSYEDMQRHPLKEWTYQLDQNSVLDGHSCYVLISIPKPETETQYTKIVSWIDQNSFVTLKSEMWNKKDQLFKTYTVEKLDTIQGIATELLVIMENHQDDHKTRLTTKRIIYNKGLPDRLFTTRALEK